MAQPRVAGVDAMSEPRPPSEEKRPTFQEDLAALLNRHCQENESNTPDFIIAMYLTQCLAAWNMATQRRDRWYGVDLRPGRRSGHGL